MNNIIEISKLAHTWLIDLDGTLLFHNSHLSVKGNKKIENAIKILNRIPEDDKIIILTSRSSEYKKNTLSYLRSNGIRFDLVIFDLPLGERILINDIKPQGLKTAICINCERDNIEDYIIFINEEL